MDTRCKIMSTQDVQCPSIPSCYSIRRIISIVRLTPILLSKLDMDQTIIKFSSLRVLR